MSDHACLEGWAPPLLSASMQIHALVFVLVLLARAKITSSLFKEQKATLVSDHVSASKGLASLLLGYAPTLNSLSATAKPLVTRPKKEATVNKRVPSARMDADLDAFLADLATEIGPTTTTTTSFDINVWTTSSTVPLYIRENREETWDEKVERYREENREKARLRNIQFPTTTTTTESWDEKVERYRKEAAAKKLAQEIANPTTPPPPEETWEEKVERYRKEAEAKKKR